jgi:pyruvate ferredoxin oxidoreductase alpha subunit/phenylglyoxylate dehydrogenase alpha subunit
VKKKRNLWMIRVDEKQVGKIKVMNGNMAAAYGARLCKPEIISAYPITPQTPLVEYLAEFVANNELDATMVEVEGEHSAMSVLQGAAIAGSRTFTGTSAQGLAFMYEAYFRSSTLRLPMVMVVATREMNSPQTVWSGQQDILTLRDAGWIQLFMENNQEIIDTVVMAYKIAEHPDVLLPVNVCYDGFYLSHLSEGVIIPPQDLVDSFLPPYTPNHLYLDPERPIAIDPLTLGNLMMEFRSKHCAAMGRARKVITEVGHEFGEIFGRYYGNLIEQFQMDDAELVLITTGSVTGTAKVAVKRAREAGKKIGLIKLRTFRPFPIDDLKKALNGRKAVGVIDRSVCFGWNAGITFVEVKAALNGIGPNPPLVNFIGGLGGADIRVDHIGAAIEIIEGTAEGFIPQEVTWL